MFAKGLLVAHLLSCTSFLRFYLPAIYQLNDKITFLPLL